MSTESSLTYNYDKDSFEEGTFEDISEFSEEEEEEEEPEESDMDENYSMQIEMTKIVMPKYSPNNKNSLKTLIEEDQKGQEESDTEQEDEQTESDKIYIEEVTEVDDNSYTDYEHDIKQKNNEANNDDISYTDYEHDIEQKNNEANNDEDENNSETENTDSDDLDVEMKKLSELSNRIKENEKEYNRNQNKTEDTDIEDNSDSESLDSDIKLKVNYSEDKMGDDFSEELILDEDKSDNEDDETNETNETSVELIISSKRPSSFNSDDHAYHLDFIKKSQTSLKSNGQNKSKNVNKNLSFSNDRLRDIERQNKILLQRILTKKPTYENLTSKNSNRNLQARKITSAAINRKKQQHQIDIDNQILKRKLEAIALRRRTKQ